MCENALSPVSMLMSSGRWERGSRRNNEQTHPQPYNLKGLLDDPVELHSINFLVSIGFGAHLMPFRIFMGVGFSCVYP